MPTRVTLTRLDPGQFGMVAHVEVADDQRQFLDTPVLAQFLADAHLHPTYTGYAVVACDKPNDVVGYVSLGFVPGEPGTWWIPLLIVDHRQQRRGYGGAALEAVRHLCLDIAPRAQRLGLSYKPDNVVAGHLYHRAGFRPESTLDERGEQVAWLHFHPEMPNH